MKHGVFGRRLDRDINARKALLKNLASALIVHGQIITTLAKAKFVRSYVEKLVTDGKRKRLHLKRVLAGQITPEAFLRLTDEISPGFTQRNGGYTRIVKLSPRKGDAASMARLEFLQWEKSKVPKPGAKKASKKGKATQEIKSKIAPPKKRKRNEKH